jgi:hypothetical protein
MANQLLTLTQIQDAIWTATVSASGLAPQYVRHAYPTDGQPAWKTSQNVIIINITPYDDPINKQRDISYSGLDDYNANETVSYIDVFQTQWTFYGPQGYDIADQVRSGILLESIRDTLSLSYIYPVAGISAPTRLPYNFAGQWWEQSDLRALFNTGVIRQTSVAYLQSATVNVTSSGGPSELVTVVVPPYIPAYDFTDDRNSQYAPLLFGFSFSTEDIEYTPSLDFSNPFNSGYIGLIMSVPVNPPAPVVPPSLNFQLILNSQYIPVVLV